jgi:hypothetical protein
MKRILILVLPLVLFAGFLTIKPPAIGADATPTGVTSPESIQSPTNSDQSQSPNTSKPPVPTAKPSILGGNDDDDDDDDNDDDDDEDEKPSYGGHDDDDYDD